MSSADGTMEVVARIGGVGVYATPARLVAWRRYTAERVVRTGLTFLATLLAAPLGFLIPPHLEPAVVAFLLGLYFTRRAWVGEWQARELEATCPHCAAPVQVAPRTVLFLPHTLTCRACRSELWLELGEAAPVSESEREAARAQVRAVRDPQRELGGRPPLTWSPAASDWRDRPRDTIGPPG